MSPFYLNWYTVANIQSSFDSMFERNVSLKTGSKCFYKFNVKAIRRLAALIVLGHLHGIMECLT